MRFYTNPHKFYCGIDLHARSMYVCIVSHEGHIVLHRNMKAAPEAFLKAIAPYREGLVVAVECIFPWYWLADLCAHEGIPFVLGHALSMKAIHGGQAKNDQIDSHKTAALLRGGMLPQAYVYPAQMRATRDLLRRRTPLIRKRSELLAHVQNTNSQYNLPEIGKKIADKANREGVAERFEEAAVQKTIEVDLSLITYYDALLKALELYSLKAAKHHDAHTLYLLQTVPGIGTILSLVLLYEIHRIEQFPSVQDFASYCRLVKCSDPGDCPPWLRCGGAWRYEEAQDECHNASNSATPHGGLLESFSCRSASFHRSRTLKLTYRRKPERSTAKQRL